MIRPEQIQIRRAGPTLAGTPLRGHAASANVVGSTFYGRDTVVRLRVDGVHGPLSARTLGHDAPEPGERVELAVAGPVMAYPSADTARLGEHASPEPEPLRNRRVAHR